MKIKLFLSSVVAVTLAASVVTAAPHGNNHFTRSGGQHWNGGNLGGNWHHHNHGDFNNNVTFIGGFGGFPFWGLGYPYGYYGSYPYGNYGNGYYGSGYYGNGYGYGRGYGYRPLRTYYGHQGNHYGYVGYGHRHSGTYHARRANR